MTHRYNALRAKILTYLFITLMAILIYAAIAYWDAPVFWKLFGAGIFSFILFVVSMLLWDEEEVQEKNELKATEISAMKTTKNALVQNEETKKLLILGNSQKEDD